jgi:hypothetical protein
MELTNEEVERLRDALARVEPLPAAEAYVLHAGYEMSALDVQLMTQVWGILMPGTRLIPISGIGARLEPLPEAETYLMRTPHVICDATADEIGESWRERMPGTKLIMVDGTGTLTGFGLDAAADRARAAHVRGVYGVQPEEWSEESEELRERWRAIVRAALDV